MPCVLFLSHQLWLYLDPFSVHFQSIEIDGVISTCVRNIDRTRNRIERSWVDFIKQEKNIIIMITNISKEASIN